MSDSEKEQIFYGQGTFTSRSGRWTVDATVPSFDATLDGNEPIWEGTCAYTVRDRNGKVVLEHSEHDSPPSPEVAFSADERRVRLSETSFELPD